MELDACLPGGCLCGRNGNGVATRPLPLEGYLRPFVGDARRQNLGAVRGNAGEDLCRFAILLGECPSESSDRLCERLTIARIHLDRDFAKFRRAKAQLNATVGADVRCESVAACNISRHLAVGMTRLLACTLSVGLTQAEVDVRELSDA